MIESGSWVIIVALLLLVCVYMLQVKQLKQVIHQLGSTEEESTGRLPAAQAVGLSPETLTLLDKCPWSEAVSACCAARLVWDHGG